MKNHGGVVELSGVTGGTRMVYSVHTEPKYPVIGHLGTLIAKQAVGQLYGGIKRNPIAAPEAPSRSAARRLSVVG